jgi:hypothetical protein
VTQDKLQCLFRLWGHSREEDGGGFTVYRPSEFRFPLARGRDWIEFRTDGSVEYFDSGPDDRSRGVRGSWTIDDNDAVMVRTGPQAPPRRLTIVECNELVLKVRWG